jgi:pyruvate dehydrogenase E2 component (dihydrolipoamide acetyltransferase)
VVDGTVQARPACMLALSFDHRLMDGAQAGRALRDLRDLLQDAERLETLPR